MSADDSRQPATINTSRPLTTKLPSIPIAAALRRAFAKGYRGADLRADLMAGAVVGVVALPLSMALAIAVGAPPQHGLYTAIVAGAAVALLGGCKFQVTGPTAAFIVILAPIVNKHGLGGLMTAGFMAVIDATGFVALENSIETVIRQKKHVVLAGPLPRPHQIFDKARLATKHPELRIAETREKALAIAADLVETIVAKGTSKPPPSQASKKSAA